MSISRLPLSLRNLLLLDAATCAGMGAALTLGAAMIAALTRIPEPLLFTAGAVLFPIAVFMAIVALRPGQSGAAVWLVVAGNLLWVAASFVILLGGWIAPNLLGTAFIVAQALAVALLAWLEQGALRTERRQLPAL